MENKKFPEETGELMDETIVIPELEIEAEPMGQSAEDILETIIDEEGNLNLDATLDMTLEEVEALLNTENAPEERPVTFAPISIYFTAAASVCHGRSSGLAKAYISPVPEICKVPPFTIFHCRSSPQPTVSSSG